MKKTLSAIIAMLLILVMTLASCSTEEARSVRTVKVNEKGELVVVFSDGTTSVMGTLRGEDGRDGINGKDGVDGTNGVDGEKGDKGDTGAQGPVGIGGRSVESISADESGGLKVTYSDGESEVIELLGSLYLFGGMCGENAAWALYNGGILVIAGTGSTYDYEEGKTPWYSIIPLISAVYVDVSGGLVEGTNLLYGIDESIIHHPVNTIIKWVDMAVEADIYSTPDNTTEPIGSLPLGAELNVVSEADGWTQIYYGTGCAYIETKYTVDNNGSVVFTPASIQLRVTFDPSARLRWFTDATAAGGDNVGAIVPKDTILTCTGISMNGNWYRVSYDGKVLYAWHKWVEVVTE